MEEKEQVAEATKPKRKSRIKRFFKIVSSRWFIILLLLIAIGAAVFFGLKWRQSEYNAKNPDKVAQAQTEKLIKDVSRLTVLPTGETPTVASVSDVSKLDGQSFFANAENGDKVLIYSQARQAILYRPSTDQIINIAPLDVNDIQ